LLKLRQRDEALSRDIQHVEWTFDPLELKNAFFNIERLGAIVRRYVLNQYGTTTSYLHGGLPTDRCIAEWNIASQRVRDALDQRRAEQQWTRRIEVPSDIAGIRTSDPAQARAIQSRVSGEFLDCFVQDLAVIGFEPGARNSAYLLAPWHSE
jgi:predicted GNAT superfamily acetyltransferase